MSHAVFGQHVEQPTGRKLSHDTIRRPSLQKSVHPPSTPRMKNSHALSLCQRWDLYWVGQRGINNWELLAQPTPSPWSSKSKQESDKRKKELLSPWGEAVWPTWSYEQQEERCPRAPGCWGSGALSGRQCETRCRWPSASHALKPIPQGDSIKGGAFGRWLGWGPLWEALQSWPAPSATWGYNEKTIICEPDPERACTHSFILDFSLHSCEREMLAV